MSSNKNDFTFLGFISFLFQTHLRLDRAKRNQKYSV